MYKNILDVKYLDMLKYDRCWCKTLLDILGVLCLWCVAIACRQKSDQPKRRGFLKKRGFVKKRKLRKQKLELKKLKGLKRCKLELGHVAV